MTKKLKNYSTETLSDKTLTFQANISENWPKYQRSSNLWNCIINKWDNNNTIIYNNIYVVEVGNKHYFSLNYWHCAQCTWKIISILFVYFWLTFTCSNSCLSKQTIWSRRTVYQFRSERREMTSRWVCSDASGDRDWNRADTTHPAGIQAARG